MALHIILPTCVQDPDLLARMLGSLHEHTEPCHLVVVVNAREDWRRAAVTPMIACLRDCGWRVTLVEEQERIGYVSACNLGWQAMYPSDVDLMAVLNDDLVFKGRWVEPLAKQIDSGARLVGPSLKHIGPDATWGPETTPPYIEGWCLMMRVADNHGAHPSVTTQVWGELAPWLFDPQFEPQLCEDADLGLRIGAAFGPGSIRQVDIPVAHVRSVTIGQDREPYWTENRRKLIAKWNLGNPVHPQGIDAAMSTPFAGSPVGLSDQQLQLVQNSQQAKQQGWEIVP